MIDSSDERGREKGRKADTDLKANSVVSPKSSDIGCGLVIIGNSGYSVSWILLVLLPIKQKIHGLGNLGLIFLTQFNYLGVIFLTQFNFYVPLLVSIGQSESINWVT